MVLVTNTCQLRVILLNQQPKIHTNRELIDSMLFSNFEARNNKPMSADCIPRIFRQSYVTFTTTPILNRKLLPSLGIKRKFLVCKNSRACHNWIKKYLEVKNTKYELKCLSMCKKGITFTWIKPEKQIYEMYKFRICFTYFSPQEIRLASTRQTVSEFVATFCCCTALLYTLLAA